MSENSTRRGEQSGHQVFKIAALTALGFAPVAVEIADSPEFNLMMAAPSPPTLKVPADRLAGIWDILGLPDDGYEGDPHTESAVWTASTFVSGSASHLGLTVR
jgi:hypothetical protein